MSTGGSELSFRIRTEDGVAVVAPVGTLDVSTYADVRDTLLKIATDLPLALVVELGALQVPRTAALSVFTTVAQQLAEWPVIPLLLVGGPSATILATAIPRFVATLPTVAAAIAAVGTPPPHQRATLELAGHGADPQLARAWVADRCTTWGLDAEGDLLHDAVLVASELVENALRHAPGPARLRVELRGSRLSVAAFDSNPAPPILVAAQVATTRGGRGIAVVQALALAWGHRPRPGGGKVVWAVLQVRRPPRR